VPSDKLRTQTEQQQQQKKKKKKKDTLLEWDTGLFLNLTSKLQVLCPLDFGDFHQASFQILKPLVSD
jgi:hypothetical protein